MSALTAYLMERQSTEYKNFNEYGNIDVTHWGRAEGKTFLGMMCAYTASLCERGDGLVISNYRTDYIFDELEKVHHLLLGCSKETGNIHVRKSLDVSRERGYEYKVVVFDDYMPDQDDYEEFKLHNPDIKIVFC